MKMLKLFILLMFLPVAAFAGDTIEVVVNEDLENLITIINFITGIPVVGPYIPYLAFVIATAASVATLPFIPKGDPNSPKLVSRLWYRIRLVLIEIPAMNIFAAKNAK